ncbi:DUF881 domain-containing protein [Radiobacillus sp. PE A8.2]|uniref:DUF881 domain-containing protein n=1 Tax=Radiobacillus sp. PE A8.2 TaxID=3380349 RepID=UPI00388EE64A
MKSKIIISLLCIFTGLMIAVQFQTAQQPKERDTRDTWEIRQDLQKEQKTQQQLYEQLGNAQNTLDKYAQNTEQEQVALLKKSIDTLEEKAGIVEKTGKGVLIEITPIFYDDAEQVQVYPIVTPELLNRLINELNSFGATDIAIENERIISTTPIRFVNGKTYVNNHALSSIPIEVMVLTKNPTRLLDYIQVSQSRDDFFIESLDLNAQIKSKLTLPAYEGRVTLDGVEIFESEETSE